MFNFFSNEGSISSQIYYGFDLLDRRKRKSPFHVSVFFPFVIQISIRLKFLMQHFVSQLSWISILNQHSFISNEKDATLSLQGIWQSVEIQGNLDTIIRLPVHNSQNDYKGTLAISHLYDLLPKASSKTNVPKDVSFQWFLLSISLFHSFRPLCIVYWKKIRDLKTFLKCTWYWNMRNVLCSKKYLIKDWWHCQAVIKPLGKMRLPNIQYFLIN